jgi:hypothetical protein
METNNEKAMPQPLIDLGFSRLWKRDDLDKPGGIKSPVWKACVTTPIREALLRVGENDKVTFDLSIDWGMICEIGAGVSRVGDDPLFKTPYPREVQIALEDESGYAFDSLVEEFSEIIWDLFEKTGDFEYVEISISAMTREETEAALRK